MHWADHYANVMIKHCGKFKASGEFYQYSLDQWTVDIL